ncbi:MAG: RNA 2',3'-cyclic phosphodiesterase [Myxococcales bacterium]|nr:RNA 2',3'-cyclic phosphodiesterase [Myxococcales bacterium]
MSTQVRAFLAVNFPLAVTRRVVDEVAAMAPAVAASGWKVAWVPAANLHVTLKFFGMIERASVEAITGRLNRELAQRGPLEMEARGIGAFPNPAHPRVLWAGVHATGIAALQQDVEKWMEDLGFPREPRPFHPHVTLGKVKEPGTTQAVEWLPAILAPREQASLGSGRASEVVIYESLTRRAGSEYIVLSRVPFGTAAAR